MKNQKAEDTNGWKDISDKLHGIDDERVGRSTDDMDSLLVFVRVSIVCRANNTEHHSR